MTHYLRASAAVLLVGLTGGCSYLFSPANDPLTRDGVWTPNHANRANLALQIANPADLSRGTGTTGGDGHIAAIAVARYRDNKVKLLPQVGLSQITTTNQAESTGQGTGNQ